MLTVCVVYLRKYQIAIVSISMCHSSSPLCRRRRLTGDDPNAFGHNENVNVKCLFVYLAVAGRLNE